MGRGSSLADFLELAQSTFVLINYQVKRELGCFTQEEMVAMAESARHFSTWPGLLSGRGVIFRALCG